jgi:outer membrane translocation and assembly module TamA
MQNGLSAAQQTYGIYMATYAAVVSDVGGPSKGWMRKGEEGYSIETAMQSVYILNQERNHVTKSHVKMQFTVYRVNQGARLTGSIRGTVALPAQFYCVS